MQQVVAVEGGVDVSGGESDALAALKGLAVGPHQQAVLVADGAELEPHDLGLSLVNPNGPSGVRVELPDHLEDFHHTVGEVTEVAERRLIERALDAAGGNRTHAAKALGVARRTLLYKLKRHGIT